MFYIKLPLVVAIILTTSITLANASPKAFTPPDKSKEQIVYDIKNCNAIANKLVNNSNFVISAEQENKIAHLETDRFFMSGTPVINQEGQPAPHSSLLPSGSSRKSTIYVLCLMDRGYSWHTKEMMQKDIQKWMPLAEEGDAEAQYIIAKFYEDGKGLDKSMKNAIIWYKKSAENGYVKSQYYLGVVYDKGRGVDANAFEAFKWYKMAAEQDHVVAQSNLGVLYATGQGVEKNDEEAIKWLTLAADKGYKNAKRFLSIVESRTE